MFVDVLLMVSVGLMALALQGCDLYQFLEVGEPDPSWLASGSGWQTKVFPQEPEELGIRSVGVRNNILGESRWWFQRFVIQVNEYLSSGLRPPKLALNGLFEQRPLDPLWVTSATTNTTITTTPTATTQVF